MSIVAVIPARYASSRLPGKLLLELDGKSILQRTYEQASKAKLVDQVIIATDDERILEQARSFGAQVEMTSSEHQSGSDRIAELALKNPDWQIIINVQGDEPFINPDDIDRAIEPMMHDPLIQMSSLYHEINDSKEIENPSNVKVVTDINSNALYFSRKAIPGSSGLGAQGSGGPNFKKHIGLYVYRREILLALTELPQSPLELSEKLEQLRALENGISIKMIEAKSAPIGIDTEEDYQKAKQLSV